MKESKNDMPPDLGHVTPSRKSGKEQFHNAGEPLSFDVLSFWQWNTSDFLSNMARGILAEYIVAQALDASPDGVRDEWASYDLLTRDGIKVEVKSGAYLQSWFQTKLSKISFRIPKTKAWDPEVNAFYGVAKRQADVYVFALLAHKDKKTVDPLDVSQWQFYVLATSVLDEQIGSKRTISLTAVKRLAEDALDYSELSKVVRIVAGLEVSIGNDKSNS